MQMNINTEKARKNDFIARNNNNEMIIKTHFLLFDCHAVKQKNVSMCGSEPRVETGGGTTGRVFSQTNNQIAVMTWSHVV